MLDSKDYPIGTLLVWKGNYKATFIVTRCNHIKIYVICLHSENKGDKVGEEYYFYSSSNFNIYPPSDKS